VAAGSVAAGSVAAGSWASAREVRAAKAAAARERRIMGAIAPEGVLTGLDNGAVKKCRRL